MRLVVAEKPVRATIDTGACAQAAHRPPDITSKLAERVGFEPTYTR